MEVNGQLGNCIQKEWKRLEEEVGSINFWLTGKIDEHFESDFKIALWDL